MSLIFEKVLVLKNVSLFTGVSENILSEIVACGEEISAAELEEKCASHVKVVCNDYAAAKKILSENFPDIAAEIKADGLYLMTSEISPSKINSLLVKGDIEVSAVTPSANDFENFFIERLG